MIKPAALKICIKNFKWSWLLSAVLSAVILGSASSAFGAVPTLTAINPSSGINNTSTAITSITGTNFGMGWDKENGLVLNWRLDETSVSSPVDSSGTGNNGTSNGTAVVTGKLNNARNFAGSANYLSLANNSSINFGASQNFTISAWVKTTQGMVASQWPMIVSKEDAAATRQGYNLVLHASNTNAKWYFEIFVAGTAYVAWGTSNIADGNWHHVVGYRSDSTLYTYQDGVFASSTSASSGSTQKAVSLNVGRMPNGGNYFIGQIDEVRIYNRALSAAEIADLYSASIIKPSAKLKKSGQSDITCTGFTLSNSTMLSAGSCPISGAATGAWDVQVQNGNSATGTLAGGFTVNGTGSNPDATSVTYTTGGDGGISGDSITITGSNFGTVSAGSRANCSGGAGTGCIKFITGSTATVADADITSWASTSITFTLSAALLSNGGASALQVFAASSSDATPLTFYVYPNITAVASVGSNAAREYNAADNDGLIMLSGDHFGPSGSATIFALSATQHGTTGGSCTVEGYASTSVCLEVPASISDTLYTGNITLTRGTDSKTASSWTNFRILPRIAANNPATGVIGDTIQITGDHFCETGTCPSSGSRSTAADNVKFGSTQAADSDFVAPTNGSTSVTSVPFTTTGSNRLLLAFISIQNASNQTVSSISDSGAGLTWVLMASSTNGTNARLEIWRAFAPSIFSGTVTATLSSSAKATILAAAFSGVNTGGTNGSGAIGAIGSAVNNNTTPSVVITTTANNSLIVSALAVQGTSSATAGSNQTLISAQTTTGGADSTRIRGAAGRQNSITASPQSVNSNYILGPAANWAMVAVEIKK